MSVVFTTISDKFIAMCADKQEKSVPKIEKWAAHIAVGISGDITAGEYIRSSVHQFVAESGITNFNVEDVANLFAQKSGTAEETVGTTKFIIAQRVSSVQNADRIIVMEDGEVNGFGTHEELLATNEIYREVYESQTKGGGDFDEKAGE